MDPFMKGQNGKFAKLVGARSSAPIFIGKLNSLLVSFRRMPL